MTDEQIAQWKVERDIARSIEDKAAREKAMQAVEDHRDDLMMNCIAHQSARTKLIKSDVEDLKEDIASVKTELRPCVETDKEYRLAKERAKGVKIAIEAAKWIIAAGGGGLLVRVLSGGQA